MNRRIVVLAAAASLFAAASIPSIASAHGSVAVSIGLPGFAVGYSNRGYGFAAAPAYWGPTVYAPPVAYAPPVYAAPYYAAYAGPYVRSYYRPYAGYYAPYARPYYRPARVAYYHHH